MDVFIARQPIFDKSMNVVAYELLYRNSKINTSLSDGDDATSSVLINGLLVMGLETLTDKKKAFIKFTKNLILDETVTLFKPDNMVVEVLEDVEPDGLLIEAIRRLKDAGYTVALDEYVESDNFEEVLNMTDIIKVDFQLCDEATVVRIAENYRNTRIKLFAEKLETQEQFDIAKKLGYTYFQGHFFAKPKVIVSKDIKSFSISHIRIMQELGTPEPDYKKISEAIESDLGLSYKLLKLVNSGIYFGINNITSIHQALVRLGIKEVAKWMTLVMMRDVGANKPEVLARTSIIRARALETLASKVKLEKRKEEFFLLGMLSMMDVIMGRSMKEILKELPLDSEIKSALVGEDNILRKGLEIILAYELADWDKVELLGGIGKGMIDEMISDSYFEAIRWTQELYVL